MHNRIPANTPLSSPLTPRETTPAADAARETKSTPAAPATPDRVQISKGAGEAAGKDILVRVLPQDPSVGGTEDIKFSQDKIGKVVGDKTPDNRVRVDDGRNPKAIADPDGNFFYNVGTPQFDQVNAHTVVSRTLDMYQGLLGHKINWAFSDPTLTVKPHAEEGQNAYYSRWEKAVNFFYFNSPALQKTVQTSEAADVVSHETGHAVLDALRPNYMGGWSPETGAVHESFGDMTAMLFAMQDDQNLALALQQTGGDLSKPSLISNLAEEFGLALHRGDSDPKNDNQNYLRTALNKFVYQDPSTLPDGRDDSKLTSEVHNFSRLFTGTFYDGLKSVYDGSRAGGKDNLSALKEARDVMAADLAKGVELAPVSNASYHDLALAMLKADKLNFGGQHVNTLGKVFVARKILSEGDVKQLTAKAGGEFAPPLRLPGKVKGPADLQRFIESHRRELGIPEGVKLEPACLMQDGQGNRFATCEFTREVPLDDLKGGAGPLKGLATDLTGGLCLSLGPDGTINQSSFADVDAKTVSEARREIKKAFDQGLVTEMKPDGSFENRAPDGRLYKALVYEEGGRHKIKRIPVAD